MSDPVGIKQYGISELRSLMESWGEPAFRVTQLVRWLYSVGVSSYQQMTDLPKPLRLRLEDWAPLFLPTIVDCQKSSDGTQKYVLQLADGLSVEAVGIPDHSRLTVCFSTQAGCSMGCVFCTTGSSGLHRSLAAGEMVDQLTVVSQNMKARATNAVAMGEGEPFANYDATLAALRILNSPDGPGIGARRLTVSTCGTIRQIDRFTQEPEQFTLAVSLHSAVQSTRDKLMPALTGQRLDALRQSLIRYTDTTGRRLSLEVVLIDKVNDTPEEVRALLEFARGLLCHVNLIPLNPLAKTGQKASMALKPSSSERISEIAAVFRKSGIECSIRRSRGADILGACGQLKGTRP